MLLKIKVHIFVTMLFVYFDLLERKHTHNEHTMTHTMNYTTDTMTHNKHTTNKQDDTA